MRRTACGKRAAPARAPSMVSQLRRSRWAKQGLVLGVGETTVRRPAVADQHAAVVASEHAGGLLEAPSVLDGVHADVGCGERPEPHELTADLPSRLVGAHHWRKKVSASCWECSTPCGADDAADGLDVVVGSSKSLD
jgi:hypothetical protein